MSDTLTISASLASLKSNDLYSALNIDRDKLSQRDSNVIMQILGILAFHKIDDETASAILKSFEVKNKPSEDLSIRLTSFKTFLDGINHREDLIDSVKNLGMLSKEELESQARENGDWISVIKRTDLDKKLSERKELMEAKLAKESDDTK